MNIKSLNNKLRECPNGFNYLSHADSIVKDVWIGLLEKIDKDRFHNEFTFVRDEKLYNDVDLELFKKKIIDRFQYHMTKEDFKLLSFDFDYKDKTFSCIVKLTRPEAV